MKYLAILLLLPAFTLFADDRLDPIHDALDECASEKKEATSNELLHCAMQKKQINDSNYANQPGMFNNEATIYGKKEPMSPATKKQVGKDM